jgi:hypothetical protein
VSKGSSGAMGEKEGEREMAEFESRRLWAGVAKGIREGDFELASREKARIEVGCDHMFPVPSLGSKGVGGFCMKDARGIQNSQLRMTLSVTIVRYLPKSSLMTVCLF